MENKDTSTDYQKFVGVRNQKWEVVEITIGIFFFFAWDLYSLFLLLGVFKSHLKKISPTQSAHSHQKSQFDLNPSNINLLKNDSFLHPPPLPPITQVKTMEQLHCQSFTFLQPLSILWQFYYSNTWKQKVFTIIKRKPVNNEK